MKINSLRLNQKKNQGGRDANILFMAIKNCIIIHGCPFDAEKSMSPETRTYDKHWMPWIKKQLIANGVETETPLMPSPWQPDYERFKSEFEKYPVDETIKDRVKKIIMFTADDEEENGKESLNIFHQVLGGEVIELKGRGHYTQEDMKTEQFPELLAAITQ